MLWREYESRKTDIQKQIFEYQSKLEDKASKLHVKEHELDRQTRDVPNVHSVIQPFRNYKVDFTPPQITEKVLCSVRTNELNVRTDI